MAQAAHAAAPAGLLAHDDHAVARREGIDLRAHFEHYSPEFSWPSIKGVGADLTFPSTILRSVAHRPFAFDSTKTWRGPILGFGRFLVGEGLAELFEDSWPSWAFSPFRCFRGRIRGDSISPVVTTPDGGECD